MRRSPRPASRKDLLVCAPPPLAGAGARTGHVKRLMAGFESAFQGRSLTDLPMISSK